MCKSTKSLLGTKKEDFGRYLFLSFSSKKNICIFLGNFNTFFFDCSFSQILIGSLFHKSDQVLCTKKLD